MSSGETRRSVSCVGVLVRRLQVRLEARVLVPERIHVDDEVLHRLEVRHRIDRDGVVVVAAPCCTGVLHARPVVPLMFIEHEPQIAERHERRNEIEPSISAFAFSSASSTVMVVGNVDVDPVAMRHVVDGFVEAEDIESDLGHRLSTLRTCGSNLVIVTPRE